MKKFVVLALVLATACFAFSQTKKGDWLVGTYLGSTGLSFSSSESGSSTSSEISKSDYHSFSISVGPTIGYFVADNLAVGTYFSLGLSSSHYKNSYTDSSFTSESDYSSVYFSLGPFGRYYFGDNGGKGRPFVHVNVGINLYPKYSGTYTPISGTGYNYKYKTYSSWNAGLQVGYEHFLNSHIGLQYYIGYSFSYSKYSYEYVYTSGSNYVYNYKYNSHGITLGVGLQIHLTKKEKAVPPPPPPPPPPAPKKKK
jgi:outer membrane protein W